MAEERQDRAIILRNRPFQERHALITALTEHHGLVKYLALNARHSRRFGASLGHLMVSRLSWTQKNEESTPKLLSAVVLKEFKSLQSDYDKLTLVAKFVKLIEMVHPKEDSGYSFFVFFSHLIVQTDAAIERESLETAFLLKFLFLMGVSPQLDLCVLCGQALEQANQERPGVTLSPDDGGVICSACKVSSSTRNGRLLNFQELRELREALNCRYADIGSSNWKTLSDKSKFFYSFLA
jgi:DNA repair protein RecO (recombination protein O)